MTTDNIDIDRFNDNLSKIINDEETLKNNNLSFSSQWNKYSSNTLIVGLSALIIIFILLFFINPPITQKKGSENPDMSKIATWSIIGGLVVATGPLIYNYFTSSSSKL